MDDLLRDYLRSLEARKLSLESIRTARSVLNGVHARTGKPLAQIAPSDLADWQHQRAGELSVRSLRKSLVWVHGLYSWALLEERIPADPSLRLRTPKAPRLLPKPIPEHRLALAVESADDRMRAILCLAGFAGLRAGEIAHLAWSEVDLDAPEPTLRVIGKGSKERILDLSPDLVAALRALPHRRGAVIRRGDGRPGFNSPGRISQIAGEHLHGLGIPDTLHSLRHRLLTVVCRIGGLREAQEVAGHASAATTSPYTLVARRDLRATVVQAGRLLR